VRTENPIRVEDLFDTEGLELSLKLHYAIENLSKAMEGTGTVIVGAVDVSSYEYRRRKEKEHVRRATI